MYHCTVTLHYITLRYLVEARAQLGRRVRRRAAERRLRHRLEADDAREAEVADAHRHLE